MIISVNWLKQYTDITLPLDELATLIGARLVEIEEVQDITKKYDGIVIAKVMSCEPVPDSDHLNLTKLDDAGVVKDVERDENGYVQVVCGAPNVREGLTVVWLPPGVTVPSTWSDDEPFVLGARKLRGVISNGMIASAKELDLYDDHSGILEVVGEYKPGDSFGKICQLDDTLLDIENKSLTHRPDTFGVIGFAREVAAIQGQQFTTPEWLHANNPTQSDSAPKVTIEDAELSPRYQAVVIENLSGKRESDLAQQTWLSRVGLRPISAIVDATNYLMMLTGQPLHAFDYDKLVTVNDGKLDIRVRAGRGEGDTLVLLDGREITLTPADIVIANGEKAVALAGAMGGQATEVDEKTTKILLEAASFNLYNLRATQMRHGIFSEAITRFTKGQSSEQTAPVLQEAIRLYETLGGVVQDGVADIYPVPKQQTTITVPFRLISDMLGTNITEDAVKTVLESVSCTITRSGESILVTVPYWRADLSIPEDIVEEIGRIKGFDTITPTLPSRDFTAVRPSEADRARTALRRSLVSVGANEVVTYSFVHGDLLKKAGQDPKYAYNIVNSISPDLQYYRLSLTPSLLDKVHSNIRAGFTNFALFETNKVHFKGEMDTQEPTVPNEDAHVALVLNDSRTNGVQDAPYYTAKRYLEQITSLKDTELISLTDFDLSTDEWGAQLVAPYEPKRSAVIVKDSQIWGVVGEYKQAVKRAFKLSEYAAGFEVHRAALSPKKVTYVPLSKYPSAERDICFKVDRTISYQALVQALQSVALPQHITYSLSPLDIFSRDDDRDTTKNITLRFTFTAHDKTLTGEEVAECVTALSERAIQHVDAIIV